MSSRRVTEYASIEKFFIEGETGGDDIGEGEDIYIYIYVSIASMSIILDAMQI